MSIFFATIIVIKKIGGVNMPVIAIPQMGNDLFRKYMKSKYVQSLERAGAQTLWIELEDIDKAIETAPGCDGLLLPGGADIDPKLYGQTPSEKCGKPNEIRDAAEPKILEAFLKTGKPILGICRGVQLLNVYMGGTLLQDIKDKQKYNHSDFFTRAKSAHPISIIKNTKLYDILGTETAQVNSLHHQAIDKVGDGLKITAKSADGYIEALELEGHPFCVAVQWHPEHMSKKSDEQRKLFSAFVAACDN